MFNQLSAKKSLNKKGLNPIYYDRNPDLIKKEIYYLLSASAIFIARTLQERPNKLMNPSAS